MGILDEIFDKFCLAFYSWTRIRLCTNCCAQGALLQDVAKYYGAMKTHMAR